MLFLEKIKKKWSVESDLQLLVIFLVFGITGSLSTWLSKPVLAFFDINRLTISPLAYWTLRILIIFPIYQMLLLVIGTIFGQYSFFKNFVKKMFLR
ncbi:MAG: diacylglyceryl transferase [Candidatus Marinimicrobia bacterium]|nr:diacylglyceryl transferase [Candidatus Neomarinimicrobiota bacterium]